MALTPIDIELLRTALTSVCDEMFVAIMKSAYSTNIKERHDHSAAVFDAQGRIVAQGESLPLHLSSMLGLVEVVLGRYGAEGIRPGDMFISNDPFAGRGSHLPDVAVLAPVFQGERLVMFVANIAHHADVGGMAPGSMSGGMSEIYQEGIRIPPIRIVSGGEIIDDVFQMILLNVRVPRERRGDYLAQIAANRLGIRRLQELMTRWDIADLQDGMQAIIKAVARRIRAGIAEIPDGTYSFADVLDDDGMGTTDIPIKVKITIKGDRATFDFAGSGPQVRGNMNNSYAGLQAAVLFGLKVLVDPDGPTNHGMLEPVTILAPADSVVNASFPAATAARAQTCQRMIDVVLGAFAKAIPDRVIAASNGANGVAAFSGTGPDGTYYLYMETIGGGAGARSYKDGVDGVQVHVTNTSNLPIEALENEYPLLIERYELVEDSGGAGQWRGGMGLRRVYRGLGHRLTFSGQGERAVHPPWGLFGGKPGGTSRIDVVFDNGRRQRLASKPMSIEVEPDAMVWIETPGAGGYGPPRKRSAEDRAEDVRSGKLSARYMRANYPGAGAGSARKKPRKPAR